MSQSREQTQESVTIEVSSSQQPPPVGEAPVGARFLSAVDRCKDGLLKRPIQYDIISIIFTLVILGGGIYAYISMESTASLVASFICALLLAVGTYFEGSRKNPYPLLVVLLFIGIMFSYRYYSSGKFMPSGLFTLLTVIMLGRHCYLLWLKRDQESTTISA